MSIKISYTPAEIMWDLKKTNTSLKGRCFENCVIAVVSLPAALMLHYILGFVTPPGHDPVAHAWLQQDTSDGPVYFDPTLQDASPLWMQRKSDFFYDVRYRLTKQHLLKWFRDHYADRTFSEIGIPEGMARGPIINDAGDLE